MSLNPQSDSPNSPQLFQINERKRIALVAHDSKKCELIEWVKRNREQLIKQELHATGTTGKLLESTLGIQVMKYKSGPLGGDQQLGAKIAEQCIDLLIFLADPLEAQPHDSDVKALTRLACVWNIPMACNISTADFILTSPYFSSSYTRVVPSFENYLTREITHTTKDQ
jgi:methylglyoxal synthase